MAKYVNISQVGLVGMTVMAYKTETENKMFGTQKQWLNIYQGDFNSIKIWITFMEWFQVHIQLNEL